METGERKTGRQAMGVSPREPLQIDVALSPDEARNGVVLRIGVPVFEVCPACRGSGRIWNLPCSSCSQGGVVVHEQSVPVHIAPLLQPDTITDVLLDGYGISNLCLRLRTFVTS